MLDCVHLSHSRSLSHTHTHSPTPSLPQWLRRRRLPFFFACFNGSDRRTAADHVVARADVMCLAFALRFHTYVIVNTAAIMLASVSHSVFNATV